MIPQDFQRAFSRIAVPQIDLVELVRGDSAHHTDRIAQQRPTELQHLVFAGGERTSAKPRGDASRIFSIQPLQIFSQKTNLLQLAARGRNGRASLAKGAKEVVLSAG